MESNKYTIKSINSDGSVSVLFDCDGKTQTLANTPVEDADSLKSFISEYLAAYKRGKEAEVKSPTNDVKALVGKDFVAESSQMMSQES